MQTLVEILAFIGGVAVVLGVFVAVACFIDFLWHTRKLADDSVKKCCSLESMLFDISRRSDDLSKEVHLLKATDKSKESS